MHPKDLAELFFVGLYPDLQKEFGNVVFITDVSDMEASNKCFRN
jgi:hypothetical protein